MTASRWVLAWMGLGLGLEIPPTALPLDGPVGGMVGLVRDAAGQPLAGATLTFIVTLP